MRLFLLAATFVVGAGSHGAIRAVTPDLYGGDPDAWQMKRHAEKMSVATNGGAQVVFIGDSITHGWKNCPLWDRHFANKPYKVLNLGASGDCTDQVLGRLVLGHELDGYEAKIVFLMIGTNNHGRSKFANEPPSDVILGIREILRVIRRKQPTARLSRSITSILSMIRMTPRSMPSAGNFGPDSECWRLREQMVGVSALKTPIHRA